MRKGVTTLTERGQVSMPASLRKALRLKTGQRLHWERVSDHECRVLIIDEKKAVGAKAMLGFARQIRKQPRRTRSWIQELREGER